MLENNQQSLIKILNTKPANNQEDFNYFLASVLKWIFTESIFSNKTPNEKIKLLFYVVEKNDDLKNKIRQNFEKFGQNISLFEFFATNGITRHSSFVNEFMDRLFSKFSIYDQTDCELSHHFTHLLTSPSQVQWIKELDEQQFIKINNFLSDYIPGEIIEININESITFLVTQLSVEGLDPKLHKRYFTEKINSSVFFQINAKWVSLLRAESQQNAHAVYTIKNEFEILLRACRDKINQAPELFQLKGVDSDLVFKLEKIKSLEHRINQLFNFKRLSLEDRRQFIYELLSFYSQKNQLRSFASSTFTVIAKQVITINAAKASDYIAKNKEHFIHLFKMALGGGLLTAFTVIFKFLIAKTGLTGFWLGFFQTVNYSSSFLLIHYFHFTLATKQPANTASLIANLLTNNQKNIDVLQVINEVKSILKSQLLSVFGNLISVIPSVLIFHYMYLFVSGENFLNNEKAFYTLNSLKVFSLVPVYAIFTGLILWSNGLVGGWVNNFFIFYDLDKLLINRIRTKPSTFFSTIFSNLYLGFFLGVLPEILKFMHLPLDVRHITLSTGTLFLALPAIGFFNVSLADYLNIILGLIIIAFFNIFTSFYLTIKLSFRASSISKDRQRLIYRKLLESIFGIKQK